MIIINKTDINTTKNISTLDQFLKNRPTEEEALSLSKIEDIKKLTEIASCLRDEGHRNIISFSRKIFIPLTKLCRDFCHYCTFAEKPKKQKQNFMTKDEVMELVKQGEKYGCKEALFTLGEKPEKRYRSAQAELESLGHKTTLSYLTEIAKIVISESSLMPHINAGTMSSNELKRLREVSVSQGLMLESSSKRLTRKGGPHFGSKDKIPAIRLETIRLAGLEKIPLTSGILIGIGETRTERIESLLELRKLNEKYGHIQEIIIQNFRAKPGTKMQYANEPGINELEWTIAIARIIFGSEMNIQAPPNLSRGELPALIDAGINDWGGISPVTPDFVNPEFPWPNLSDLSIVTSKNNGVSGIKKILTERLAIYPDYVLKGNTWLDSSVYPKVLQASDREGFAREDSWLAGKEILPPEIFTKKLGQQNILVETKVDEILGKVSIKTIWSEKEIETLLTSRGDDFDKVCKAADELRKQVIGDVITYTINRNINYTNICTYRCGFCAFSKGKMSENLRGKPYDLNLNEIISRSKEAWELGATEICLQGGIHPHYSGKTYLEICKAIKSNVPEIHIHAFSPLEVWQGAKTLGITVKDFLLHLRDAGLDSLPGTAAEVLDDEVRAIICPDKLSTKQWLSVMRDAHNLGFKTTSTLMFGHVEKPQHLARHFLRLIELQRETNGFTEFVPLPFVHMEAPIFLKGKARKGPTFRESVLIHAVARLILHPHFKNIQTSWVKMGPEGVKGCLNSGANDLGGTLMNESITRAAGAIHGQEMSPAKMEKIIKNVNRTPKQRTTIYGTPVL